MQTEWNIASEEELQQVAKTIIAEYASQERLTLCLYGDLGAGKTTFVQYLGRELGVSGHITSPTFTIMSRYETEHSIFNTLQHIDAYRIDDESEVGPLRLGELLQEKHTIVCIEWPEKIASVIPENAVKMQFEILPDESRKLTIV